MIYYFRDLKEKSRWSENLIIISYHSLKGIIMQQVHKYADLSLHELELMEVQASIELETAVALRRTFLMVVVAQCRAAILERVRQGRRKTTYHKVCVSRRNGHKKYAMKTEQELRKEFPGVDIKFLLG